MFREKQKMPVDTCLACHGGEGPLICRTLLADGDSKMNIRFMHHDILPPGSSIGDHPHEDTEEVYYLLSGSGEMRLDGAARRMEAGDISVVSSGHSHGIRNTGDRDMELLVCCVRKTEGGV